MNNEDSDGQHSSDCLSPIAANIVGNSPRDARPAPAASTRKTYGIGSTFRKSDTDEKAGTSSTTYSRSTTGPTQTKTQPVKPGMHLKNKASVNSSTSDLNKSTSSTGRLQSSSTLNQSQRVKKVI